LSVSYNKNDLGVKVLEAGVKPPIPISIGKSSLE
jgi:hypothetical protein